MPSAEQQPSKGGDDSNGTENNLTAKYYRTGSAGMKHRGLQSSPEMTDSIITLRLDECTRRIVNDRTYRRGNIVHRKKAWQAHDKRDCDKSTWRSTRADGKLWTSAAGEESTSAPKAESITQRS